MVIVMHKGATDVQVARVVERIAGLGLQAHPMPGPERLAIGVTGGAADPEQFRTLEGVVDVIPISRPVRLVSREARAEPTVLAVRGATIGGGHFAVMAGPCAVESREQILEVARAVKAAGASVLRGGAYKPRTSPYSFQGLRDLGLRYLAEAREATGLAVVTEVKDVETLPMVAEHADILQIGARNMQNFSLLEAVGQARKPVLLKRGLSSTVEEWLMAAEYLASNGNFDVILCERGIRTFETVSRNTLDLGIVPFLRELTHLPVIVDPSHATGKSSAVPPLARAAVAVGADGLMVEVHPDPARALSDGPQSLEPAKFAEMMEALRAVATAVGVTLW